MLVMQWTEPRPLGITALRHEFNIFDVPFGQLQHLADLCTQICLPF